MSAKPRILVVDDNADHAEVVAEALEGVGYQCKTATSGQAGLRLVRSEPFDLVVTDLVMHGVDGMLLLHTVKEAAPDTEVIVMTAHGTVETAVAAMEAGAFTFITKPVDLADIRLRAERGLERARMRREVMELRKQLDERFGFEGIIGSSPAIAKIIENVRTIAPSNLSVIITGEPGTGKELFAKAIHQNSARRQKRFVPINCSTLEGPLLESELFGHVKGAYTGADRDREGKFEFADGGTLFLDEVSDLPSDTQAKLLRVLQDKKVTRLGSNKTIPVDVRVVSATNTDLRDAIKAGRFREDLHSRLHGFLIEVPALSQRPGDIPQLTAHFVAQYAKESGKPIDAVAPDALALMQKQRWSGNVRELQQFVQGVVLFTPGRELTRGDVASHLERFLPPGEAVGLNAPPADFAGAYEGDGPAIPPGGDAFDALIGMSFDQIEQGVIRAALRRHAGNRKDAADALGISERTVYRRLSEYNKAETPAS